MVGDALASQEEIEQAMSVSDVSPAGEIDEVALEREFERILALQAGDERDEVVKHQAVASAPEVPHADPGSEASASLDVAVSEQKVKEGVEVEKALLA